MNYTLQIETMPQAFRIVGEIAEECGQVSACICALVLCNKLGLPVDVIGPDNRLLDTKRPTPPLAPVNAPISGARPVGPVYRCCGKSYHPVGRWDSPNMCPSCCAEDWDANVKQTSTPIP